jgi:hypothetical protein
LHGRAVAQHMRCDALALQRWAFTGGHVHMLADMRSTASRLSRSLRLLGNRGSVLAPARSASQARRAFAQSFLSGVDRSFRPLPMHRTCEVIPRTTSSQFKLTNSDTLRPVCKASRRRVRSRRPNQVAGSGAALRFRHGSDNRSSAFRVAWMALQELVGNDPRVEVH